mgnify:CR=1 FL=1
MKGPGIPGFRRNAGSGFYKGSGFNINTSNRSPIKQGEGDDITEITKQAEAEARHEWDQMSEQEREAVGGWKTYSTDKVKEVVDNQTMIKTVEKQFAIVKGDDVEEIVRPGEPGYDEWLEAVTKDPSIEDRYKNKLLVRENQEVEIFEPKKEIEYTNFRLSYGTTATPGKAAKIDKNDYTARFNLAGMDGVNMTGQLSKNDIEKLVKQGKLKYEEGSNGTQGQLFMSKDFYDNYYMPQQKNYENGQRRKKMFQADAKAYRLGQNKYVQEKLNEEFPKGDSFLNKDFERREKELKKEYQLAGAEKNYYANVWKNGEGASGAHSDIPAFMMNDANYGQVQPGIYNDDETTFDGSGRNTSDVGQLIQTDGLGNSTRGGRWDQNVQGDRGLDWVETDELDEYGLPILKVKEGAKTLPPEVYGDLSNDERRDHIMSTNINGAGVVLGPEDGHRDENGTWIPGGWQDRPTKWDHYLTNKATKDTVKSTVANRHNLEATEDQVTPGGADSERANIKVETKETDLGYSTEDQEAINNI